jgi:hypothetical protein
MKVTIHDNERLRKAVVADGVVVNVIVCAADFAIPGALLVDAGDAQIGWLHRDGALAPPDVANATE